MQAKTDFFEDRLSGLAELGKAIAHPARLAILEFLASRDSCICGEIVDELPLAQASVSRHLKTLKEAGLIKGEVDGPRTCYCLNHETLETFRNETEIFFEKLTRTTDQDECC